MVSSPQASDEEAKPSNTGKHKHGARGRNKKCDGQTKITMVNEKGVHVQPIEGMATYQSMCGVLSKDSGPISILDWRKVDRLGHRKKKMLRREL